MIGAILVVSALWVTAPARAEPKPISDRWAMELPEGGDCHWPYIADSGFVFGTGGAPLFELAETGSAGPIAVDPPPEPVAHYAPCVPEQDERAPRVWWLTCAQGRGLHAFVAHDDGLYLHVVARRDTAAAREMVRSLRPRQTDPPETATTTLGVRPWLVLHPEPDRPLARVSALRSLDAIDTVTELAAPGAQRVTVTHVYIHTEWRARRKGTFWRKVQVLGRPVLALRVDEETVVLAFGRPSVERSLLFIWGRTREDLERGVRLIEGATADSGPSFVGSMGEPTYRRGPKVAGARHSSFVSLLFSWLCAASCIALLGGLALWRMGSRRRVAGATGTSTRSRAR